MIPEPRSNSLDKVAGSAGPNYTRALDYPPRCTNGTASGREKLVGHKACLGHGGDDTTWTCRTGDQTMYGPPAQRPLHVAQRASGRYAISTKRGWEFRRPSVVADPTAASRARAGWSIQPPSESKELIDHYGDSQQHQQCHDEGGTHSLIIRPEWQADCQLAVRPDIDAAHLKVTSPAH
jgi:hypothetical protein